MKEPKSLIVTNIQRSADPILVGIGHGLRFLLNYSDLILYFLLADLYVTSPENYIGWALWLVGAIVDAHHTFHGLAKYAYDGKASRLAFALLVCLLTFMFSAKVCPAVLR